MCTYIMKLFIHFSNEKLRIICNLIPKRQVPLTSPKLLI